jgi:hypothetical protein
MNPRLLAQEAILACLLALMLLAPVAEVQAQIYVRQDFATLTTAQINALKNGIAVMKRRSMSDPTSWLYQANITAQTTVHNGPPGTPASTVAISSYRGTGCTSTTSSASSGPRS